MKMHRRTHKSLNRQVTVKRKNFQNYTNSSPHSPGVSPDLLLEILIDLSAPLCHIPFFLSVPPSYTCVKSGSEDCRKDSIVIRVQLRRGNSSILDQLTFPTCERFFPPYLGIITWTVSVFGLVVFFSVLFFYHFVRDRRASR